MEDAERAREVERLLLRAVDRVTDGFVALSADWHYVFLNTRAAELLGRPRDELIGRHIWTEFPEGVGQPFHLAYQQAMREQRPVTFEEHYAPWDRWFENRVYPSPEGLSIFFSDTTERHLAEERVRVANERLVEAQRLAQVGSWEHRPGDRELVCSEELLRIHGLPGGSGSVALADLLRTVHPGDRERVTAELRGAWERAEDLDFHERVVRADGIRHLHVRGRVFRAPDGRPTRMAGTTQDVTSDIELQSALRASERRVRAILEHTPAVVYVKEPEELRYVEVNAEFLRVVGVDRAQVIGRRDEDILPPETVARVRANDLRVLETGAALAEEEVVARDGEPRTYLSVKFPLPEPDGRLSVCGISTDITAHKQREQALRREREATERNAALTALNERLTELDELRTRFVAEVSHELRTPLALVVGRAEQLRAHGALEGVQRDRLDSLLAAALGLADLVDQILAVATLERDPAALEPARFDLAALVRGVGDAFEPLLEGRGVRLVHDARDVVEVDADPDRVERVVVNLVGNAVRAARAGGVVRTSVRTDGDAVVLEVADDGPGIPPADRARVFERFDRGSAPAASGGTGLGLAIVRDIARLHGGAVEVADAPEGGALLRVRLPARAPGGSAVRARGRLPATASRTATRIGELQRRLAAAAAVPAPATSHQRVLVAEDHPDLAQLVADCLGDLATVELAADGHEALARARAAPPAAVVTDLMLPGLGGEALLERLRAAPETATVPIVVLTARAEQTLRERLLERGADDFVVKPFAGGELRSRVAALLRRRAVETELERLNDDLRHANAELQTIAAGVAHDLVHPLATADLLAGLAEDRAEDGESRELLDKLRASLARMRELVVALRGYAELGAQRLVLEEVDTGALLDEVLRDLRHLLEGAEARVIAGALAPVRADRVLLGQLLQNLVANAVVFRGDAPPVVEVAAEAAGGVWRLRVSDNGIGLDPAQAERAFRLFERVGGDGRPGSGVGLAVCQLVARRHGGVLRAAPRPQGGTTFELTLPATPAEGLP